MPREKSRGGGHHTNVVALYLELDRRIFAGGTEGTLGVPSGTESGLDLDICMRYLIQMLPLHDLVCFLYPDFAGVSQANILANASRSSTSTT